MATKTQAIHNLVKALGASDAKYTDEGTIAAAIQDLADAVEDGAISAGGGSIPTITVTEYDDNTNTGTMTGFQSLMSINQVVKLVYDGFEALVPLDGAYNAVVGGVPVVRVVYFSDDVAGIYLNRAFVGSDEYTVGVTVSVEDNAMELRGDTESGSLEIDGDTMTFKGSGDEGGQST